MKLEGNSAHHYTTNATSVKLEKKWKKNFFKEK